MTATRWGHTATLLGGGTVLIAGGFASSGISFVSALASAEVYDPTARTFTATGSMTVARAGHAAMSLGNGKVLVAGGSGNASKDILASAELYE
jgi:hypothetical protein